MFSGHKLKNIELLLNERANRLYIFSLLSWPGFRHNYYRKKIISSDWKFATTKRTNLNGLLKRRGVDMSKQVVAPRKSLNQVSNLN